jgi:hypothetical protein
MNKKITLDKIISSVLYFTLNISMVYHSHHIEVVTIQKLQILKMSLTFKYEHDNYSNFI